MTKGILDALNRNSYSVAEPLKPDRQYTFEFPLWPEDYVFKPGHRIGIIVVGSYPSFSSVADETRANIKLYPKFSRMILPVVGGKKAAKEAGL